MVVYFYATIYFSLTFQILAKKCNTTNYRVNNATKNVIPILLLINYIVNNNTEESPTTQTTIGMPILSFLFQVKIPIDLQEIRLIY